MDRPNILLFMVDQMRADMIAALGNEEIETPNLDRLVKRGTAFSNAFSPSPVCVPARCSLHYGMYPSASECYENNFSMPENKSSFMDILSAGGYRTHGIGKCHFTPDLFALRGFQTREVQEEILDDWRADDYLNWLFNQPRTKHIVDPHGVRGDMYYMPQISLLPPELHPTNWVGQRAVDFLKENTINSDRNWMLFCSFVHPHPPFSPPSPWNKKYRATDVSLPVINENCEDNYTYINRKQNRYKFRDRGFDLNHIRCMKAHYYACISFVDSQIGKVLDQLEQTGQIDNTLIIFTSDHGEHLGDNRCFGKRSMHDQAARIPLLASLPGMFESGAVCDNPVSLIDVLPTMSEAAKLPIPKECQGVNLAEIVSGECDRDVVYSEYAYGDDSLCMIVSKKWKYFYSVPDAKGYLFDRMNDAAEAKNLAADPEFKDVVEEYHGRLTAFLYVSERDDVVDSSDFKPLPVKTISEEPDDGLLYQDHVWAKEAIEEMVVDDRYSKIEIRS